MEKSITVKGIGSVSAKPDLIVITMNLTSKNKEYEKTVAKGAAELDAIRTAIVGAGLESSDLKTTDFAIKTESESIKDRNGNYEQVFRGYACRHGLKLEFDFDMKLLSDVIGSISRCAAIPEFSIQFSVRNKHAVSEQILVNAAENARNKAEILAKASGVRLGELLSINYSWGELHLYSQTEYSVCEEESSFMTEKSMDINPEDIEVNDSVTFVWEIVK